MQVRMSDWVSERTYRWMMKSWSITFDRQWVHLKLTNEISSKSYDHELQINVLFSPQGRKGHLKSFVVIHCNGKLKIAIASENLSESIRLSKAAEVRKL